MEERRFSAALGSTKKGRSPPSAAPRAYPNFNRIPLYRVWYNAVVADLPDHAQGKRLPVIFYRSELGREPVRGWLKSLPYDEDRKRIGVDIKTVEFGWPVGMPTCRPLKNGIFEVRTSLTHNRIARVLFYVDRKSRMVLLHAFIKKTRSTPDDDLAVAQIHKRKHQQGEK